MLTCIGKESETEEFKETIGQLDKGTRSLSAMLNRYHHGTVYYGVDDGGNVKGIEIGESTLEKIRNSVRSSIQPRVIPDIKVNEAEGRKYISVSVTGHDVPYSCDGKYYIRNVTSDESAGPEIVSQLVLSRGMDPLRDIRSDVQELTFESLFASLVSHGHHPRNDDGYYRSIGILDDEGKFNLNGYLLSDQNSIPMQIVEFRGTDRSDMYKRTDFGNCSLIRSMETISEHISGLMETIVDTDGTERKETALFDYGAFREAWVNACVHNAWRTYTPPSVLLFDDRMEIISYGRIPFFISFEDFFTGDSRPVNSGLFNVFAKLNKIEQSGHGVPRIVRTYGREAFHITDSGVKITMKFRFRPGFVTSRMGNLSLRNDLSDEKKAILRYLRDNPDAKLSDVANVSGLSLSYVKKAVMELKSKKMLRNDGTNRNSRWTVIY